MNISKFRELSRWFDGKKESTKVGLAKRVQGKEYILKFSGHGNNVQETVAGIFLDNLNLSLKTGNTFILNTTFNWSKQIMKGKGLDASQFLEYMEDFLKESKEYFNEILADDKNKNKWDELFTCLIDEFISKNKKQK